METQTNSMQGVSIPDSTSVMGRRGRRTNSTINRQRIYAFVQKQGDATTDEIEVALGMSHQTASSQVSSLKKDGLLVATARRRMTRLQCPAAVLEIGKNVEADNA